MGKVKRTSAIVLVLVMVFMTASCGKSKGSGSGVGNKMMIYAADHSDEYVGAAKQYFDASFVTSSDPQTEKLTKDNKIGFVAGYDHRLLKDIRIVLPDFFIDSLNPILRKLMDITINLIMYISILILE